MSSPGLSFPAREESVLHGAIVIRNYYNKFHEQNGGRYNVFTLLGVTHDEAFYSIVLGDLLNPHGSHDLGDAFLGAFVDQFLHLSEKARFQTSGAQIKREVFIGVRTATSGGRLDLRICDQVGVTRIIIENKVGAPDQDGQLLRYHNFAPNAAIVYLTPFGDPPSAKSLGVDSVGKIEVTPEWVIPLSYQKHIVGWLESCRHLAIDRPKLRETLSQFIQLIQIMTETNPSPPMSVEICDLVNRSPDNLRAYASLLGAKEMIRDRALVSLRQNLESLATQLSLDCTFTLDRSKDNTGFSFTNAEMRAANIKIRFEYERMDLRNFCFGFAYVEKIEDTAPLPKHLESLRKHFISEFGKVGGTNPHWPCWMYWKEWDLPNIRLLEAIADGDFCAAVFARVEEMLALFSEDS